MSGLEETFAGTGTNTFSSEHSSWRINLLFFFLTASQITFWPWIPIILVDSGLTQRESGLGMSALIFMSCIGMTVSLKSVQNTRSGPIRRCFLFGTCTLGVVFGLSALLVAPGSESFCGDVTPRTKVSYSGNQHPMSVPKRPKVENSLHLPDPVQLNFTKPYGHLKNEETVKDTIVDKTLSKSLLKQLVNTNRSDVLLDVRKNNNSSSRRQPTEKHLTPRQDYQPNQSVSNNKKYIKQVKGDSQKQIPDSDRMEETPNEKSYLQPVHSVSEKSQLNLQEHTEAIPEVETTSNVKPNLPIKKPIRKDPFENLDKEAQNQRDPHKIPLVSSDSKVNHDLNKEKVEGLVEGYVYQPFNDIYHNPYLGFPPEATVPFVERKGFNYKSIPPVKDTENPRKYSNNIVPDPVKYYGYEYHKYDPLKAGPKEYYYPRQQDSSYMRPIRYAPTETDRGLPARHKRSVDNLKQQHKRPIGDDVFHENLAHREELPNISESFGWGIFILFLLAGFFSGGTEVAISKLWHCMVHGVPHDRNSIDGIEAVITPSLRLIFLGAHRKWTLVTSSLWIIVPTIFVAVSCEMEIPVYSPFKMFSMFFVMSGIIMNILIWLIPVPFGNLSIPRTSRPLSLYLDDEVIQEGLRRIGFHSWVFLMGTFISLPHLYTMWVLSEADSSHIQIMIAQSVSLIAIFSGEAAVAPIEKWVPRKLNVQGIMACCGVFIFLQNILVWKTGSMWTHSISTVLIGYSTALVWISVKENAVLLGTSVDQEHESWISWISWKCGLICGAAVWGTLADSPFAIATFRDVFAISAASVGVCSLIVLMVAALTRTTSKRRRRVYHTLDLHLISDDEDSDESEVLHEPDWLVKRAKKEGMKL